MRITVTLDDETHERLVEWAKADRRSVASTAAMLIEFSLTKDENVLLRVPDGIRVPERPTKGGNASSDRVVTDLAPPPTGPAPGATRPSKPVPTDDDAPHDPATCLHPKNRQRLLNGGAVICDLCNGRVR
jgi:hypothetical protein